ncbi:hypothetical protein ABZ622_31375 [Streptomyces sp. NPDC007164]|uniref:hypothetical protein n=1 Tax=Streptomyces sp. NPDC007164 TaxID=3156918 RepID=UPI0033DAB7BD
MADRLQYYGLSRVSALTGLDVIELPLWTAMLAASGTLCTAQVTGEHHRAGPQRPSWAAASAV